MSRNAAQAAVLAIFGITGDLARKMTFRSLYRLEVVGRLNCPFIGVAMDDWSEDQVRASAREAVAADQELVDEGAFDRLAVRLSYLRGDFAEPTTYDSSKACPRRCSAARCTPVSPAGASTTSRTRRCPRCAKASAARTRRRPEVAPGRSSHAPRLADTTLTT